MFTKDQPFHTYGEDLTAKQRIGQRGPQVSADMELTTLVNRTECMEWETSIVWFSESSRQ